MISATAVLLGGNGSPGWSTCCRSQTWGRKRTLNSSLRTREEEEEGSKRPKSTEERFVSHTSRFKSGLAHFLGCWSAVNWKRSGWKQVWATDSWAQTKLRSLPEGFIQPAGWEPKELTALRAETSASQLKNNIALTEMATVCLFLQKKKKKGGRKAAFSAGGEREG